MRILVVDDDRQLCAIIKRGLLEEAYAVDLAYDGEEGEYLAGVNLTSLWHLSLSDNQISDVSSIGQ
jgi:DNA-binding response OmpR family regulator